jgi:hypothetical protein
MQQQPPSQEKGQVTVSEMSHSVRGQRHVHELKKIQDKLNLRQSVDLPIGSCTIAHQIKDS